MHNTCKWMRGWKCGAYVWAFEFLRGCMQYSIAKIRCVYAMWLISKSIVLGDYWGESRIRLFISVPFDFASHTLYRINISDDMPHYMCTRGVNRTRPRDAFVATWRRLLRGCWWDGDVRHVQDSHFCVWTERCFLPDAMCKQPMGDFESFH